MPHRPQLGPLGEHDASQAFEGAGHIVVDDHKIVLGKGGDFLSRHLQPPLNGGLAVCCGPAAAAPTR